MEEIRAYLQQEDPDYQAGVELLSQHSGNRNRSLVNQLQRKHNAAHVEKLRYELAKIVGEPALAALPTPPVTEHQTDPDERPAAETPDDAGLAGVADKLTAQALEELEAITIKMGEVYNQKAALSNQLGDCSNRAERKRLVDEIDAKEQAYNILAVRKQLLASGQPAEAESQPVVEQPARPDLAAVGQGIKNLRSNLSKAKRKLEAATSEAKKSEYAQKVGQLSAELQAMELDLKRWQS